MFTRRLAEYINTTGIEDITAYADSFPAPKDVLPHVVGVFHAGDGLFSFNKFQATRRFVVTGSAQAAMAKAMEIFEWFCAYQMPYLRQFAMGEYYVMQIFPESEPQLVSNVGNIFQASFVLTFQVARDS